MAFCSKNRSTTVVCAQNLTQVRQKLLKSLLNWPLIAFSWVSFGTPSCLLEYVFMHIFSKKDLVESVIVQFTDKQIPLKPEAGQEKRQSALR